MILLAFGWMLIGSVFIVGGWFRQGWRYRFPATQYNAALVLAVGMDLHALGFAMQLYGRIEQILFDGATFDSDDPIYWLGTLGILAGKTAFVWVAALKKGRDYSRPFVYSYGGCLAAWAVFVAWWHQVMI